LTCIKSIVAARTSLFSIGSPLDQFWAQLVISRFELICALICAPWRLSRNEARAEALEQKMTRLRIPHNAFVFVGDGRKALFLRNEGDEKFPNLKTESVFEDDNPLTHEQGSERPGRVSKALDSGQRSAVEPVDWHRIEEHRFAKKVAAAIEQVVRERKVPALVVVAPPKTLADLRNAFHVDIRARVIAEIGKDLTKHPIGDIEKHLISARV
jgi:protein required for attachment to host cells